MTIKCDDTHLSTTAEIGRSNFDSQTNCADACDFGRCNRTTAGVKGGDCSVHDQALQMHAQGQTVSPLSDVSFCGYTGQIMYETPTAEIGRSNFDSQTHCPDACDFGRCNRTTAGVKGGDCSVHDQALQMHAQGQTVSPLSDVSFCGYTGQIMYETLTAEIGRSNFDSQTHCPDACDFGRCNRTTAGVKGGDCSVHDQALQMHAQGQTVSPLSDVSFCGYTGQIMYETPTTTTTTNFDDDDDDVDSKCFFDRAPQLGRGGSSAQNLRGKLGMTIKCDDTQLSTTAQSFEASKFDVLHADQDELALYEIEARLDSESNWDRYNADTFDFDEVWVNPLDFAISCTKQLHTRKLQNLWKRCQGLLPSLTSIATQTKLRKHTPLNHSFTRSPVIQKTVHTRSWAVKKAVLRKRARIVETETKVPTRTPHFDSVHTAVLQFCNTLPSIVDSRPIARRVSRTRSLNTCMLPSFAQWTDTHNSLSDIQRARKWRNNVRRKRQPQYKCDRSGTFRALNDMNLGYHTEKPALKFAVKIGSLRCDTLFGAFGSTCEFRSAITGEMATAGRSRAAREL